jgi:hypothetical protein
VLLNEQGHVVASGGGEILLSQVSLESAAGTTTDPYIARGSLFGACYGRI